MHGLSLIHIEMCIRDSEVAVEAFLGGRVRFGEIARCVRAALEGVPRRSVTSLEDVFLADHEARAFAQTYLGGRA